jgi:hypothetical protein
VSNTVPANADFSRSASRDFYVVNGQHQPSIRVRAMEPMLLRIVNAVGTRTIELEFARVGCRMHLISRDGVFQYTPYPELKTGVTFLAGNRADISVVCDLNLVGASISVAAVPSSLRDHALGTENRVSQSTVFTLVVDPPSPRQQGAVALVPTAQAPMPAYLQDLFYQRDGPVMGSVSYGASVVFGRGALNGVKFQGFSAALDQRYLASFCLGQIYDVFIGTPASSLPNRMEALHSNEDGVAAALADPSEPAVRFSNFRFPFSSPQFDGSLFADNAMQFIFFFGLFFPFLFLSPGWSPFVSSSRQSFPSKSYR